MGIDLTTTCFVVKQDIIENSQVPAEKQANKSISSKQDQHNNSSDGSTIQPSEEADKGSFELANVPIEQAQSNDTDDLIIVVRRAIIDSVITLLTMIGSAECVPSCT